jgi:hypothetical protein
VEVNVNEQVLATQPACLQELALAAEAQDNQP